MNDLRSIYVGLFLNMFFGPYPTLTQTGPNVICRLLNLERKGSCLRINQKVKPSPTMSNGDYLQKLLGQNGI